MAEHCLVAFVTVHSFQAEAAPVLSLRSGESEMSGEGAVDPHGKESHGSGLWAQARRCPPLCSCVALGLSPALSEPPSPPWSHVGSLAAPGLLEETRVLVLSL